MSDNVHALAALRDAEMFAVKHLPLEVIPQFIKRSDDRPKRPAAVMAEETFDVLKEKKAWSLGRGQSRDLEEESASRIAETSPSASKRESLTRKSSADKVDLRHRPRFDASDVAVWSVLREVAPVYLERVSVDL
jgi:hypothetical protein